LGVLGLFNQGVLEGRGREEPRRKEGRVGLKCRRVLEEVGRSREEEGRGRQGEEEGKIRG